MALSRERIAIELRGLLAVADPLPMLELMLAHGIWKPVLPEFTPERLPVLARTIAAEAESGLSPAWQRRLAALLPPDRAVAEAVAARLRLANADKTRIGLAAVAFAGGALLPQAWTLGAEALADRLLIAGDAAGARQAVAWQRPRLPVSGRDLLARGLAPGPQVAARLGDFERAWVAAGFPMDEAAVTALLDTVLAP
jgi:poly(A) polymerase